MEFDPDFFEGKGGGNIISIHDYYHDNTSLSEIDTVYKPQFERNVINLILKCIGTLTTK